MGPRFVRGGDSPDFEHAFSNRIHLLEEEEEEEERKKDRKKEERKKESVVKHKSADKYVGRPNEWRAFGQPLYFRTVLSLRRSGTLVHNTQVPVV